jgi:hypothetical protein
MTERKERNGYYRREHSAEADADEVARQAAAKRQRTADQPAAAAADLSAAAAAAAAAAGGLANGKQHAVTGEGHPMEPAVEAQQPIPAAGDYDLQQ